MPREITLEQMQEMGRLMRSEVNPNKATDAGTAERFAYLAEEDLRFCEGIGWMAYDGGVWRPNDGKPAQVFVESLIPFVYAQAREKLAAGKNGADAARELISYAKRLESLARMTAAIELASYNPKLRVTVDRFDVDPMVLNVKNGVIDLRTGELMAHSPSQLFMRQAAVEYLPDADCPLWLQTLDRIFAGRQELVDYIQRAFGYAITGAMSEQAWFIAYGCGANGKSTILNVLLEIMGNYAGQAAPDLLIQSRNGNNRHPAELADLMGRRFILAQESAEGALLDEAKIKQITGGDKLKARLMHQNFFEFSPICKIWLSTNHKPQIKDTTISIWRRTNSIPFTVTIPAHERDGKLPEKLRLEYPGILKWAVDGCLAWQKMGLAAPAIVTEATAAYRQDQDIIGQFIGDCCEKATGSKIKLSALYAKYRAWAEEGGRYPVSDRRLSEALAEKGFSKKRYQDGFYICGLTHRSLDSFNHADNAEAEAIPINSHIDLLPRGGFMENGSASTSSTCADDCEVF